MSALRQDLLGFLMFLMALGSAAFALCGGARITMMPKVD